MQRVVVTRDDQRVPTIVFERVRCGVRQIVFQTSEDILSGRTRINRVNKRTRTIVVELLEIVASTEVTRLLAFLEQFQCTRKDRSQHEFEEVRCRENERSSMQQVSRRTQRGTVVESWIN